MKLNTSFLHTLAFAGLTLGCGSVGSVNASIWGEAYIEQEIPAITPMNDEGFENGWTIRFTKFLVHMGGLTIAAADGTTGGSLPALKVYDLHTLRGPLAIGALDGLEARRFDRISYRLAPVNAQSTAGNATAADLALMRTGGYSIYVEGNGTRAGLATPVTFRWGFTNTVSYANCHSTETEVGVAVPSGGSVRAQITVHGDHLFYDDLQSPDAKLRFDLIAGADMDRNNEVTMDELARVDLTTAPMGQYGTGPFGNTVRNLREFITVLVATVGHFNGEGHCDETRM